uniref:Secreted protein n=1 Tax=Steinernema glaseri TaxID=37863 RepID=A0A1I7XZD5_9BILA
MNRRVAVVSIAFVLATYASAIGAGAGTEETPKPKPWDPYSFDIPWFVIPLVDNRVAVFFVDKRELFYVFYELDDLSEHVKNGSARIMQFHEQTKHTAKKAKVGVELADLLKCTTVTNKDGKLEACGKQLTLGKKLVSSFAFLNV